MIGCVGPTDFIRPIRKLQFSDNSLCSEWLYCGSVETQQCMAYCSLSGVLIKATTPLDKTIFHMVDVANPSTAVALLEYQARQSLEVFANLSATFRCQIL